MAMFSMVAIMSSCSKSDDDAEVIPEPEPQPELKYCVRLVAPLTDVQLELMDLTIKYTLDTQSATIPLDKMQKISLPLTEAYLVDKAPNSVGKTTVYCIDIPGEYTEEELSKGSVEYIATGKKENYAKYVNVLFNFFGKPKTIVDLVGTDWKEIDVPELYMPFGDVNAPSEQEIFTLIDNYNFFAADKEQKFNIPAYTTL